MSALGPAQTAVMRVTAMTEVVVTDLVVAMAEGPCLGRGMRTGKNNSGEQSSDDLQFHYDVFPSYCERDANLFRFVFTM